MFREQLNTPCLKRYIQEESIRFLSQEPEFEYLLATELVFINLNQKQFTNGV
jgi:hypothetical protein